MSRKRNTLITTALGSTGWIVSTLLSYYVIYLLPHDNQFQTGEIIGFIGFFGSIGALVISISLASNLNEPIKEDKEWFEAEGEFTKEEVWLK